MRGRPLKQHFLSVLCLISSATLAASGVYAASRTSDPKATESQHKPVIELFTSQGCSSCPPADKLLGVYAARGDVIALTLPVDYWDYLGWKDTLASPKHSERQRNYARTRRDGLVYTPQVVINGMAHAVGSNASAIDKKIGETSMALSAARVAVSLRVENDTLLVQMGDAPPGLKAKPRATVWLATVKKSVPVTIRRGENRGRKITYYNVVRELTPIGIWQGKAMTIRLPKHGVMMGKSDGCTVLVQNGRGGPIVGAAELKSW